MASVMGLSAPTRNSCLITPALFSCPLANMARRQPVCPLVDSFNRVAAARVSRMVNTTPSVVAAVRACWIPASSRMMREATYRVESAIDFVSTNPGAGVLRARRS